MDKEICEAIRKHLPSVYGDKSDSFIIEYCSLFSTVEELISNKGLTIKQAFKTI